MSEIDEWVEDRHRFLKPVNQAEVESNHLLDALEELEVQTPRPVVKALKAKHLYKLALCRAVYRDQNPKSVPTDDLLFIVHSGRGDAVVNKYRERIRSPLTGIRAFCAECMGGSVSLIRECASTNCPIYPFRMGNNPFFGRLVDAEAEAVDPDVEEPTTIADQVQAELDAKEEQ